MCVCVYVCLCVCVSVSFPRWENPASHKPYWMKLLNFPQLPGGKHNLLSVRSIFFLLLHDEYQRKAEYRPGAATTAPFHIPPALSVPLSWPPIFSLLLKRPNGASLTSFPTLKRYCQHFTFILLFKPSCPVIEYHSYWAKTLISLSLSLLIDSDRFPNLEIILLKIHFH